MKQTTLTGFEKFWKTTRRAQFLADMDKIIPWAEPAAAVQSVYRKVGENGGPARQEAGDIINPLRHAGPSSTQPFR